MNRHVNAIAGRLSLRAPQRRSLEILDRITEIAPPGKEADIAAVLEVIRSEYPSVTDFEREFPSLCFALATGVGKTRLMGAFISYLHLAHGINNFFVLAPNLTIYNKLIADFSDRTHPKYVFKGISEFAIEAPTIITGDNYDQRDPATGTLFGGPYDGPLPVPQIDGAVTLVSGALLLGLDRGRLMPYGGAGAGALHTTAQTSSASDTDTTIAWTGIAGMTIRLNRRVSAHAEYRYTVGEPTIVLGTQTVGFRVKPSQVVSGLSLTF